jgi:hypothetical protein
MYSNIHGICQVYELNKKIIDASKDRNSPLFNVPPVVDPSNEIAEVLVEDLEWNRFDFMLYSLSFFRLYYAAYFLSPLLWILYYYY